MDAEQKQAVKDRLEAIRERNGGTLTPADVVADAKQKTSPLHDHFTWDDKEAAHQHRLNQARELIRSVRVEVTTSTHRLATPFYIRDPRLDPREPGYTTVYEARSDKSVAIDALREELARAVALLERTLTIAEALEMEEAVQDLLVRTKLIQQSIALAPSNQQQSV